MGMTPQCDFEVYTEDFPRTPTGDLKGKVLVLTDLLTLEEKEFSLVLILPAEGILDGELEGKHYR